MSDVKPTAQLPVPDHVSGLARLRLSSLGLVSMLILQFILGIIYALYGTAPSPGKSVGLFSSPVLALHVILFFLLVIAAVGQLVRAFGARHRLTLWMSALGWSPSWRPASRGSASSATATTGRPWVCRWPSRWRWPPTSC